MCCDSGLVAPLLDPDKQQHGQQVQQSSRGSRTVYTTSTVMLYKIMNSKLLVGLIERPPPKVAPVGMTPGGVLLRENRMYGCENSVHKETPCAAHNL